MNITASLTHQANKVFTRLRHNGLVNASLFIGTSSFINIASVFVVQKVIAIYLGPAGVALIGQYQNFLGIVTTLANGGINSGIVKYVAEFRQDIDRNASLISNALRITLLCSAILIAILLLFPRQLSIFLFQTKEYTFIIRLFGLTIVLFALNALFVSILNGFGEIKKYAGSAIARTLVQLGLTVWLSIVWGLTGALVALTVVQSLIFFVTLSFVVRSPWFTTRFFVHKFDRAIACKLLAFSLMALTSGILVPWVQIGIRNNIIKILSLVDAGYWDAMWKISQGYLSIITGTLSVYYMPKLSSLQFKTDIRREIWNGYKLIIPFLLVGFTIVFFLRIPIVHLL
jgi:O-antigen/teichoic acid export membrane protein